MYRPRELPATSRITIGISCFGIPDVPLRLISSNLSKEKNNNAKLKKYKIYGKICECGMTFTGREAKTVQYRLVKRGALIFQ